MRPKLGLALAVGVLVFPTAAQADNGRPTVQRATAERRSAAILRTFPSWRYRDFGFIDCGRGKINRYTWVCRVGWGRGHSCHRGRVRITGVERAVTSNIYDVHFRGTPVYSCEGVG